MELVKICREHGMSAATSYKWRSKYGGVDTSMLRRVKKSEKENSRPKRLYAESQMESAAMKEALVKKW